MVAVRWDSLWKGHPCHNSSVECTLYSVCEGHVPGRAPEATAVTGEARGSPCVLLLVQPCCSCRCASPGAAVNWSQSPEPRGCTELGMDCWHSSAGMGLCPVTASAASPGTAVLLFRARSVSCWSELNVEGFCLLHILLRTCFYFFLVWGM